MGVTATAAALEAIARVQAARGPVAFFQSGGCCDGSSPICVEDGEIPPAAHDLLLGHIGGAPFYIDADQYERWNRPQFLLDVSSGAAEGFSLEGLEGIHFVVRSTVCEPRLPLSTPSAADSAC